jgi:hypothetical protein
VTRALVATLACTATAAAAPAEPLEYAVKAAFLSKFGFYVDWPNGAFAGPAAPLSLCVVGDDPFGNLLDDAVAGQGGAGRPIVVRRLKTVARDSGCHIAYLGGEPRPGTALETLRGSAALVVTDARNPVPTTGTIHFVLRDNRVRFSIDDEAASQSGLAISSKLLGLALSVKPRGGR